MPVDIPKYALRSHSFERLAHPVQHIAGARRAPALLYVVCSVPRFIARTVLDESRLVFRRCLASEANIRKNSLTTPESAVCSSRRPTPSKIQPLKTKKYKIPPNSSKHLKIGRGRAITGNIVQNIANYCTIKKVFANSNKASK